MSAIEPVQAASPSFSVGGAIGFGWRKTWKNFWRLLLVVIVFGVITAIVGAIGGVGVDPTFDASNPDTFTADQVFNTGNEVLFLVGTVLQMLVSYFLSLGIIRLALAVTNGEKVSVGKLFSFAGYGRYLLSSIIVGILISIGVAVGVVPGLAIAAGTDSAVWAIVGVAVGIVIAIVLTLGFSLYGYAIIGEDARGVSSLGASWRLVKPHFGGLFGLFILLAVIYIGLLIAALFLGVLMLVIGLLITLPMFAVVSFGLSSLSIAYAYRTLAGQPVAS
ncbi:MAG: hypothetical protein NTU77_12150 [Actinobacteria bacterium]|nr:hypothetical protein [Actinomycetota bacterium]